MANKKYITKVAKKFRNLCKSNGVKLDFVKSLTLAKAWVNADNDKWRKAGGYFTPASLTYSNDDHFYDHWCYNNIDLTRK